MSALVTIEKYDTDIQRLTTELEAAIQRAERLQAFKDWVHSWLDKVGVPHDPDAEHNAKSGCRISGRLEWLRLNALEESLSDHWKDVEIRRLTAERDAAIKRAEAAECDNLGIIEATETLDAWTDYDTQTAPEVLLSVQAILSKPHPGESIRAELAALRRFAKLIRDYQDWPKDFGMTAAIATLDAAADKAAT